MKKTTLVTITFLAVSVALNPAPLAAQPIYELILNTSKGYNDVLVTEVLSGDTFRLESGEIIKMLGVISPKPPRKKKKEKDEFGFIIKEEVTPETPIEVQALEFTRELIEQKHVRLEFDVDHKDTDHRTVAYVFLLDNDIFVNVEVLRQGFADLTVRPPNTKYEDLLREAYQEARRERRGLQGF